MPRRKLTEEEKAEKKFNEKVARIKSNMERELSDLRKDRIPDPAYIYSVGDRVSYGNWNWTHILKVLDNGKIYKCFSVTWKTKMNVADHSGFKIHYNSWYELLPYKKEFPEKLTQEDDVMIYFQQRYLSHFLRLMFDKHGIDLNPDYQRGNVWTLDQKVNLIDSIFKNIDIGKFTVIKRPWGDRPNIPATTLLYEMLDGKQRLTAIYEFFIGKFKYNGLYFHELHPRDRNHFREYQISYAESEPLTNEQKYRYFLKLNTTGTPIDKHHLDKVKQMWQEELRKTT